MKPSCVPVRGCLWVQEGWDCLASQRIFGQSVGETQFCITEGKGSIQPWNQSAWVQIPGLPFVDPVPLSTQLSLLAWAPSSGIWQC